MGLIVSLLSLLLGPSCKKPALLTTCLNQKTSYTPTETVNLRSRLRIAACLPSTFIGDSCVSKEGFETIVHVLLKVTMEQRKTGLIGSEIDDRSAVVWDDDGVLHHARGLLAVDFDQFPEMAVQVHWVSVVGTIPHDQ